MLIAGGGRGLLIARTPTDVGSHTAEHAALLGRSLPLRYPAVLAGFVVGGLPPPPQTFRLCGTRGPLLAPFLPAVAN
jgi:hypothetical protein